MMLDLGLLKHIPPRQIISENNITQDRDTRPPFT